MNTMQDDADAQPDTLAELIRAAGRRQAPPEDAYRVTLAAATTLWRTRVRHGRQRRALLWAAAAGVVAIMAAALLQWRLPAVPQAGVVRVARAIGTVQALDDGAWLAVEEQNAALPAGARLRTVAGSRAGLLLDNSVSLRLAAATEVQVDSAQRVYVARGTVYVDTGVGRRDTTMEIITPAGTARDVGTQFELLVSGATLRLRVREGRVEIDRGDQSFAGTAGEQLSIDSLGRMTRGVIAPDDAAWQWTQGLGPAPELDGHPATELLAWAARETGRVVRYASLEAQQQAERVILRGNMSHLAPLEALEVMLATTDLGFVLIDGTTIEVHRKAGP
jgi:hypothetical protein